MSEPGPDKRYAEFLQQGEFHIQFCEDCQKHVFYPRLLCSHCGSINLSWVPATGQGTVYSTSVARQKSGDYNISLVDLAEGPRMMTRVEGIEPDQVRIGMKVEAFVACLDGEDQPLVLFKPLMTASGDKA